MGRPGGHLAWWRLAASVILVVTARSGAGEVRVEVDASKVVGTFRALHGVNNGPIDVGGTVDLSAEHRALAIPSVRVHDAHWPEPDVVDLHAVFPDPDADPDRPESYRFARTDEYLKAIVATGARVVFRLGESIEHSQIKRFVHPPRDPDRWARACVGVVRHYNEGWADGHRLGIRDWEVWNEPDNRPNCWTGTDDDYSRLHAATTRALRRRFPEIRICGPAVGNVGTMAGGRLEPSPFVARYLAFCKKESVVPDVFTWHLYAADPLIVAETARGVRGWLDREGWDRVESDLGEWNYLPDGDWSPVLPGGQGLARERFYDRVGGAEGAAFAARTLILLQDAPVDRAHYYAGDTNPFGLFSRHGVPRKTYHAFRAVRSLLDTPDRLRVETTGGPGVDAVAGANRDRTRITVLIASTASGGEGFGVDLKGFPTGVTAGYDWELIDGDRDLQPVATGRLSPGETGLRRGVAGPSVSLLRLRIGRP